MSHKIPQCPLIDVRYVLCLWIGYSFLLIQCKKFFLVYIEISGSFISNYLMFFSRREEEVKFYVKMAPSTYGLVWIWVRKKQPYLVSLTNEWVSEPKPDRTMVIHYCNGHWSWLFGTGAGSYIAHEEKHLHTIRANRTHLVSSNSVVWVVTLIFVHSISRITINWQIIIFAC